MKVSHDVMQARRAFTLSGVYFQRNVAHCDGSSWTKGRRDVESKINSQVVFYGLFFPACKFVICRFSKQTKRLVFIVAIRKYPNQIVDVHPFFYLALCQSRSQTLQFRFPNTQSEESSSDDAKNLTRMFDIIDAESEKGPIEIQDLFVRENMDAAGRVSLRLNVGALDRSRPLYHLLEETTFISRQRQRNPFLAFVCKFFPTTSIA